MALGEEELLSIPFQLVVVIVGGLPSSALVLCVFLSLWLHYPASVRTHCGVANWLPSVSAAVASFTPEQHIWRVLVGLHGAPRLCLASAFRNYLVSSPLRPLSAHTWFPYACNAACLLNCAENVFLLLLTSISSTDDHGLHALCFGSFAICALTYMSIATWLFHYSGRRRTTSSGEKSFQWKVLMCIVSYSALICAMYFYYRHNAFCEPGVYTLFALAEYFVVISNIAFHCTLYIDFSGRRFALTSSSGYQYEALLPLHNIKDT